MSLLDFDVIIINQVETKDECAELYFEDCVQRQEYLIFTKSLMNIRTITDKSEPFGVRTCFLFAFLLFGYRELCPLFPEPARPFRCDVTTHRCPLSLPHCHALTLFSFPFPFCFGDGVFSYIGNRFSVNLKWIRAIKCHCYVMAG